MSDFSFKGEIAKQFGGDERCAVILQHLYYWINKNRANNVNFFNGKYWTYNSVGAFSKIFYYLTHRQIRIALDKLENAKAIITDNFNKCTADRTKWYTLSDEMLAFFDSKTVVTASKSTFTTTALEKNRENIIFGITLE